MQDQNENQNVELNNQDGEGEQDFDAAFAEFSGEVSSTDELLNDSNEGGADLASQQQARDDQGRFASQSGGDDNSGAQESSEAPAATDWESNDNPWKHKYQSDLGRQSALQTRISEQQNQIIQLQTDSQKVAGDNPNGSGMNDAEWNSLKEDFPEMAGAIEARMNAMEQQYQQKHQQLEQQFQPIQQQAEQQFIQAQYAQLEQQHPDYRDVANSDEFKSWVGQQPMAVQQMLDSKNAADAAWILSNYKLATQPPKQETQSIRDKRQRQLEGAQTVERRGSHKVEDTGDFDAMFNHFADKASA